MCFVLPVFKLLCLRKMLPDKFAFTKHKVIVNLGSWSGYRSARVIHNSGCCGCHEIVVALGIRSGHGASVKDCVCTYTRYEGHVKVKLLNYVRSSGATVVMLVTIVE